MNASSTVLALYSLFYAQERFTAAIFSVMFCNAIIFSIFGQEGTVTFF